eukprot:245552_1
MLSKLTRTCLRRIKINPLMSRCAPLIQCKRFEFTPTHSMYCMQCEQTDHATGCIAQGVCGKWPETSNLQDLLIYANNGLSQYIHNMGENQLDPPLREKARAHVLESWFATMTNVNFSEERLIQYIKQCIDIREEIKPQFRLIFPQDQTFETVQNSPSNYFIPESDEDAMYGDAMRLSSLPATKEMIGDANCFGLRECAVYGLKGMMVFFQHAELMYNDAKDVYSEDARDSVYKMCFETMNDLCSTSKDLGYWLDVNMRIGATTVKVLGLLDQSHNVLFGTPEPTEVSAVPVPGKSVLISGHGLLELHKVLELIDKKGLDINVYTHCELLPANTYPNLKRYKNLVGNFGRSWQDQWRDFKAFPGPILMTSNCLIPPRPSYKHRLYTCGPVGSDELKHLNVHDENELMAFLEKALECDGFDETCIEAFKDEKPFLCGFGHASILSHAETVLNAIKSGDLQHIFVIGGCDGNEAVRQYFTELGQATPENSLILTLGCGKFRLHGLDLGDIGGIPRILDLGQCNDAYSAVVVALKLAEALGTDIHHLPLHFAISWLNQDAVAIFLALLHLGVKNIRLGPALPACLTEDVRQYLFDNFGVKQVNLMDVQEDLKQMLAETPK